jgi:hypothetical protein
MIAHLHLRRTYVMPDAQQPTPEPTRPLIPQPNMPTTGMAPARQDNAPRIEYQTRDGRAYAVPDWVAKRTIEEIPKELFNVMRTLDLIKVCDSLDELWAKRPSHERRQGEVETRAFYIADFYRAIDRPDCALYVYHHLYKLLLESQCEDGRIHKGYPLVKLSEIYEEMGYSATADRFIMLTLIEDAISEKGFCNRHGGVLWRLWPSRIKAIGVVEDLFRRAWEERVTYEKWGFCPEAVLQEFDNGWQSRSPTGHETSEWTANPYYASRLYDFINSRTDRSGKPLERLAHYLLSCIPGAIVRSRDKTLSSDNDVFVSLEGDLPDFRSDLGRQWICECKDVSDPLNVTAVMKFGRVLDSARCRAGILFSWSGVSGDDERLYSEREIAKLFQQHGIALLVIDGEDLRRLGLGDNLLLLLRAKYEKIRHDLWKEPAYTPSRSLSPKM